MSLTANGSLMKVEICNTFDLHLVRIGPFLSGRLRYVLLYNQQSIYICMQVSYTTQMSTVFSLTCLGPSFQKMTHHFLIHGSLWPTILEKNLKPCFHVLRLMMEEHLPKGSSTDGLDKLKVINSGHLKEKAKVLSL